MDEAVDKTCKEGCSSLKLFKYHGPSRDKLRLLVEDTANSVTHTAAGGVISCQWQRSGVFNGLQQYVVQSAWWKMLLAVYLSKQWDSCVSFVAVLVMQVTLQQLAADYDVIVTTYQTLVS
jgi:hypothetical protein